MTIADLHRQSLIKDPPPWGSGSDLVVTYCPLQAILGEHFE